MKEYGFRAPQGPIRNSNVNGVVLPGTNGDQDQIGAIAVSQRLSGGVSNVIISNNIVSNYQRME